MFCPRCGDIVEQNEKYCNKCGNYLENNSQSVNITSINNSTNSTNISNYKSNPYQFTSPSSIDSDDRKMIFIGIGTGIGLLILIFVSAFIINGIKGKYYFSRNNYENNEEMIKHNGTSQRTGKYSTVIIADNKYSGVKILSDEDAYELIVNDSIIQKNNCPTEIKKIEDDIINKYDITAVNLCEMDVSFAKEIANVFKTIYEEYPSVRGYLTNLTLENVTLSNSYIAAFYPLFVFATSNSLSTYPWVIKTQILLNTKYFLNPDLLEFSVNANSNNGHFPPNTTIYSPIAHELGHYLSFLALIKSYELDSILLLEDEKIENFYNIYLDFANGDFSLLMITEAYENYKKEIGTTLSIDEWRGQISNYALAKDNNGNYIYDETIAEAFHDTYLNGDNSKDVSKYIVNVLKKKLEG